MAEWSVLAQFQSGVEAPVTASLGLGIALLVGAVNPWARRRTLTRDHDGTVLPAVSLPLGVAIAGAAWVAAALAAGPLLDALGVSHPNWRIAVGLVVAVGAIVDVVQGRARPGAALPGRRAALVPVALCSMRPDVVLVASHIGLEHGFVAALVAALVAGAATLTWGRLAPGGAVADRVEAAAARLVAGLTVALAAALVVDGIVGL